MWSSGWAPNLRGIWAMLSSLFNSKDTMWPKVALTVWPRPLVDTRICGKNHSNLEEIENCSVEGKGESMCWCSEDITAQHNAVTSSAIHHAQQKVHLCEIINMVIFSKAKLKSNQANCLVIIEKDILSCHLGWRCLHHNILNPIQPLTILYTSLGIALVTKHTPDHCSTWRIS